MHLSKLTTNLEIDQFKGEIETLVENITCNSKEVTPNSLFVCLRGEKFDGHNFVEEAIKKGARTIVVEEWMETPAFVSLIKVPNTRLALAQLADSFYGHPSHDLEIIGITGTNGKTTTAYLIESIFKSAGYKIGRLSTISYQLGDEEKKANFTTPQPLDLQNYFRCMVNKGLTHCVMEVSSHALFLSRVEQVNFQSAIFTNITQDHLDFHCSFSSYLNSKIRLFELLGDNQEKLSVINIDDPHGEEVLSRVKSKVVKYGLNKDTYFTATRININKRGQPSFDINDTRINLKLVGKYNIYNALAASAVALHNGISLTEIKKGLEAVNRVCGRFEVVHEDNFKVIIDYAHTPDALHWTLLTAKSLLKPKHLITVFGCGGDRDKGKRPLMGRISAKWSDYTIITSDNPRSEDPLEIALSIKQGFKEGSNNVEIILDRKEAIAKAIKLAKKDDLVLVAGKGHEDYQIFKDKTIYFKDYDVVEEEIKRMNLDGANFCCRYNTSHKRNVRVRQ